MNLNLPTFTLMLKERCAFYGMTEFPLTEGEVSTLHEAGATIDAAHDVCCDVASGMEFWASVVYVSDVDAAVVLA